MEFIGREEEMEFLNEQYELDHSFVIISGRRRVGKSTLIEEFIKGKNALYFETDNETSNMILKSFSSAVSAAVDTPLGQFESWREAIESYVKLGPSGKKILVIDEFQYITMADSNFAINFQSIWDTLLSKNDIMVIICGSYIGMMRKIAEDYNSPLYGRNTGDLILRPLEFRKTIQNKEYIRAIEEYAVTGGVPHYMVLMNDKLSIVDNIERLTMKNGGPLVNEPAYLLSDEFRDITSYNTYLRVISEGHRKADKISSAVQAPSNIILPYLRKLIDVGLLERRVPVTENKPEHSRNGQYVISDYFMSLWFRFVYPFKNDILRNNSDVAVATLKAHFIDSHVSFVFEDICKSELRTYLKEKGIAATYGSHWESNLEIDVVAIDKINNIAYAGECKYRSSPVGVDVLHNLEKKCMCVKEFEKLETILCLFSVSGYTEQTIKEASEKKVLLFDCGKLIQ